MMAALREHGERFDIVFWEEMTDSGNINQQVAEAIMSCHLGVCYLSHRAGDDDGGPNRFADNPNVLFEAGMLYALKQSPFSQPANWIVVREDEAVSDRAPFDLRRNGW